MINEKTKNFFRNLLNPLIDFIIFLKISPNFLTLFGMLLSIFAGFLYFKGSFIYGGIVLLLGSLYDTFDGMVARKSQKVTIFGAFLDSTIDRFNEFFVLSGMILFFYSKEDILYSTIVLSSMFFSIMVSYTRARAEGLGIECKNGLMGRVERMIYIIIISFLPLNIFKYMIILFTFLTFLTVIQRIMIVKAGTNKKEVLKNG